MEFGNFIKEKRLALRLTLRTFCEMTGEDPGNWSKLERGILPPPQNVERLKQIAGYLKIDGEDEWQTFSDLAYAENGRIPEDILAEKNITEKLPIFFRTLRGKKIADEDLEKLIELIKESSRFSIV